MGYPAKSLHLSLRSRAELGLHAESVEVNSRGQRPRESHERSRPCRGRTSHSYQMVFKLSAW